MAEDFQHLEQMGAAQNAGADVFEKRRKKIEYDQSRKAKLKFLKTYGEYGFRAAGDEETRKALAESGKTGGEMAIPPMDDLDARSDFYIKKAWDDFAGPILDYENRKKDIDESDLSNKKKKVALRELEIVRAEAEKKLERNLPDWRPDFSAEEKKEYLARLEKLLKYI